MKKMIAGIVASLALSTSMSVVAYQDIPEATLAQLKQEVQKQSDIASLSNDQSDSLLKLKADLYRHNSNLEAVHGNDEHSMAILGRANQDRYDAAFAELLTDEQKKKFRFLELSELRQQIPAEFMSRYEKQIKDKGRVMKLSEETKEKLLEMKMTLYTQQQAANKEFAHDNAARNAARRANRAAYNAEFEQLTTKRQRNALQKWRKKQRNS